MEQSTAGATRTDIHECDACDKDVIIRPWNIPLNSGAGPCRIAWQRESESERERERAGWGRKKGKEGRREKTLRVNVLHGTIKPSKREHESAFCGNAFSLQRIIHHTRI